MTGDRSDLRRVEFIEATRQLAQVPQLDSHRDHPLAARQR